MGWTVAVLRRWCVVLALAWLWPTGIAAAAQAPIATCIAPDAAIGAEPGVRALFAQPTRFDCRTPQTRFGAGDFWVLSAPLPATVGDEALTVRTASLWQARTTMYVLFDDGRITSKSASSRDLT